MWYYCKRIFKLPEQWQKCRRVWEFCTEVNTVLQIWLTGGIFLLTCIIDCYINLLKAFSKTLVFTQWHSTTSHKTGTFSNTTGRTSYFTSLHSSVFYMVWWTHHTSSKYDVWCWNVRSWQLESNTVNGKVYEKALRMTRCAANQVAKQELGSYSRRGKRLHSRTKYRMC